MFTTESVWVAQRRVELRQRLGDKPLTHAAPRLVQAGERLTILGVPDGWATVRMSNGSVVQLWAGDIRRELRRQGERPSRYEILADEVHDPEAGA